MGDCQQPPWKMARRVPPDYNPHRRHSRDEVAMGTALSWKLGGYVFRGQDKDCAHWTVDFAMYLPSPTSLVMTGETYASFEQPAASAQVSESCALDVAAAVCALGRKVVVVLPSSHLRDEGDMELRSSWMLSPDMKQADAPCRWQKAIETEKTERDVVVFRDGEDKGFAFLPVPYVLDAVVACKNSSHGHPREWAAKRAHERTRTEVARMARHAIVVVVACPEKMVASADEAASQFELGCIFAETMCLRARFAAPVAVVFAGAHEGSPFVRGLRA